MDIRRGRKYVCPRVGYKLRDYGDGAAWSSLSEEMQGEFKRCWWAVTRCVVSSVSENLLFTWFIGLNSVMSRINFML